jgi:hypothetical protein
MLGYLVSKYWIIFPIDLREPTSLQAGYVAGWGTEGELVPTGELEGGPTPQPPPTP